MAGHVEAEPVTEAVLAHVLLEHGPGYLDAGLLLINLKTEARWNMVRLEYLSQLGDVKRLAVRCTGQHRDEGRRGRPPGGPGL